MPLGLFSSFTEWGLLFVAVCRLLVTVASLVEQGSQVLRLQYLQHTSSVVAAPSLYRVGLSSCGTRA